MKVSSKGDLTRSSQKGRRNTRKAWSRKPGRKTERGTKRGATTMERKLDINKIKNFHASKDTIKE